MSDPDRSNPASGDAGLPDDAVADLLAFAFSGRRERLTDLALSSVPAPARATLPILHDTLATLGLADPPMAPSAALRARLLASFKKRSLEPKAALVVIDMLKDHLTPGRPSEVPRARNIVPALRTRIDDARKGGVPVVFVVDEHEPDDPDLEIWGAHNVTGTDGPEIWPDLGPQSTDCVVKKSTYSAFVGSDLLKVLDELKVETLILTGCLTELGLLATATDAMQRGFAVEVPPDAQAGSSAEVECMAMGLMRVLAPFGPARKARLAVLTA
jgi:nicotinamidase-related amidase